MHDVTIMTTEQDAPFLPMKTNACGAREDKNEMSDTDISEFQMSSYDRLD